MERVEMTDLPLDRHADTALERLSEEICSRNKRHPENKLQKSLPEILQSVW
jgi:hypothetical protein